jgi:hypothetical protein
VAAQTDYSVLHLSCLRPLPVALAHRLCTASFGDPQMDVLKRLYLALSAHDRGVCRAEFVRNLKLAAAAA